MVEASGTPQRSKFVTGIAWIMIVLCGLGLLVSLFQNAILVIFLVFVGDLKKVMEAPGLENMPPMIKGVFEYFQYIIPGIFVVMVAGLAASVGLLKRKEWARKVYVVTLILVSVLQVVWMIAMMGSMESMMFHGDVLGGVSKVFIIVMKIFLGLTTLAGSALNVWIAVKLMKKEVRMEFGGV